MNESFTIRSARLVYKINEFWKQKNVYWFCRSFTGSVYCSLLLTCLMFKSCGCTSKKKRYSICQLFCGLSQMMAAPPRNFTFARKTESKVSWRNANALARERKVSWGTQNILIFFYSISLFFFSFTMSLKASLIVSALMRFMLVLKRFSLVINSLPQMLSVSLGLYWTHKISLKELRISAQTIWKQGGHVRWWTPSIWFSSYSMTLV